MVMIVNEHELIYIFGELWRAVFFNGWGSNENFYDKEITEVKLACS